MNEEKTRMFEDMIRHDYNNIAGIVARKNGEIVYENYFLGCTDTSRVHVYSVTKSILSILVGIAVDKGYMDSIDQKVLDFFPEYSVNKKEKTIQHVTCKNLLTMTAPYRYQIAPYIKYFTVDDKVKFTLDLLGGRGKIDTFRYTPIIGPDILSGILTSVTGQSVLAFAMENLFTPLGITVKQNLIFRTKEEQLAFNEASDISGWAIDSKGVNTGGWGLTLTPMDMSKIGQLYLNDGRWNSKQIVSEKWISESTREHSRWKKLNLPYGYLWWIYEDGFAAMGDGGNTIYVNKQKNIVVSIASFYKPKYKDRIDLILDYIEPLIEN